MGMFQDLAQLKWTRLLFYFIVVLTILAPGILIIFYFRPELFEELDAVKICLLAMGITTPVVAINVLRSLGFVGGCVDEPDESCGFFNGVLYISIVIGSLSTLLILDINLLLTYLFSFGGKGFLIGLAVLEAIYFFACMKIPQFRRIQKKGGRS